MKMNSIYYNSDYYFDHKQTLDAQAAMFGKEVCVVDLNAGYVMQKWDKWGLDPETFEYTEDNVRTRFALEAPEGQDPKDGPDY